MSDNLDALRSWTPPAVCNVPNLDAMEPDDLMRFWLAHHGGRNVRELFPEGGKSTRRATSQLAACASNIAKAKQCRVSGDIQAAQMHESIADEIYDKMPKFAQW